MTLTITCFDDSMAFKEFNDKVEIYYENSILRIYNWQPVQEVILQSGALCEDEGGEAIPEYCTIEICLTRGGNYVYKYPYSLRHVMLENFDKITKLLKKNMSSRNSQ